MGVHLCTFLQSCTQLSSVDLLLLTFFHIKILKLEISWLTYQKGKYNGGSQIFESKHALNAYWADILWLQSPWVLHVDNNWLHSLELASLLHKYLNSVDPCHASRSLLEWKTTAQGKLRNRTLAEISKYSPKTMFSYRWLCPYKYSTCSIHTCRYMSSIGFHLLQIRWQSPWVWACGLYHWWRDWKSKKGCHRFDAAVSLSHGRYQDQRGYQQSNGHLF